MEQLTKILEKLEKMDDRIIAIDTSVRGDKSRGLVGMAEHVSNLTKDFHEHTVSDNKQFAILNGLVDKAKYWSAGVVFIVGAMWGFIELVSKLKG